MYFFLSIMLLTKHSTESSVLYYLSGQHELIPLILIELEILPQVQWFVLVFPWGLIMPFTPGMMLLRTMRCVARTAATPKNLICKGSPMNPTTTWTLLHPATLTAAWLMSLHRLHLSIPLLRLLELMQFCSHKSSKLVTI